MSNTKSVVILNTQKILYKVQNDRFGTMVAKHWKTQLNPYTPRDTGALMDLLNQGNVDIQPFKLHYLQPYASHVYYGYHLNFQKKNPYSTHTWDVAAAHAGKLNPLYRDINNSLRTGNY